MSDLEAMRAEYTALGMQNIYGRPAEEVARASLRLSHLRARIEQLEGNGLTHARWRALNAEQRLEMMALCCSSCGGLDPRCQCGNDE